MIARLNPLIALLFLLPALVLGNAAFGAYQEASQKVIQDQGSSYRIFNGVTFKTFDKKILEEPASANPNSFLIPFHQTIRNDYESSLELGKYYQGTQTNLTIFYGVLALIAILPAIATYVLNIVKLEGNILTIKTFLPSRYRSSIQSSPNLSLDIFSISEIKVIRTTPFTDPISSIEKTNWRDLLELSTNMHQKAYINLFLIPGAKHIIHTILTKRSEIPLTFSKNSLRDNLKNI